MKNINNDYFSKIKKKPLNKIKNLEYASTLKKKYLQTTKFFIMVKLPSI